MAEVYLETRRDFLLRTQNLDGGWGYFPGKSSWLEPTAYSMLALHGDEKSASALDRAWHLVANWQLPDGSWRAGAQVQDGTWVSALAVTLCCVDGHREAILKKGVERLLATEGAERCLTFRVMEFFGIGKVEGDTSHPAWPWRPGTSSWIEPTVHTIVALKQVQNRVRDGRIATRVHEGEQAVLVRRCADGGWNHGSASTFNIAAPSYPESTGLALLGLQGRRKEIGGALEMARTEWKTTQSRLAKVWLGIALQAWGDTLPAPEDPPPGNDTMIAALEAIAHPQGNHKLLRTEVSA
jgi:Prenyltransferase and squalene oxidase repeat